MGFAQHIYYPSGASTLGASYTAGGASVTVASSTGGVFGTPTSGDPVRFTMSVLNTPASCCHYQCTGRAGDTLTGVTVLSGTDQDFSAGDNIANLIYPADLADIEDVTIATLTTTGSSGAATWTPGTGGAGGTLNIPQYTGGGGGTPGGSSGQVQWNNAGSFGGFTPSGDATLVASTGVITVTKTGGTPFAASATTDTTNAANISGGTLAAARGGAGAVTGLMKANGSGVVSGAAAGTDYVTPSGSGAALTGITPAQVGAEPLLAPQAVQTAGFTASGGNFYPVDNTSATVVVTLPTAPADGSRIGIKAVVVSGANVVTINAGGSDVFNKAGGSTALTLSAVDQTVELQYKAAGAIWYVIAADVSTGGYAAGSNITITTSGGVRTIAATGGGGGTPGGSSGNLQTNNGSGGFGATSKVSGGINGNLTWTAQADIAAPLAGDHWMSNTSNTLKFTEFVDGSSNRVVGIRRRTIIEATGFTQVTNTASNVWTSLLAGGTFQQGSLTLPAGYLRTGMRLAINFVALANVFNSCAYQYRVQLGGTVVGSTGLITSANTTTNVMLWSQLEIVLWVQSAGVSGGIVTLGQIRVFTSTSQTSQGSFLITDGSDSGLPTTVNTTGALAIDLQQACSIQSTSNAATVNNFQVDAIG